MRVPVLLRWLIGILVVALLALTIFWLVVRDEFRKILDGWRAELERQGYSVAAEPPSFGGWPLKMEARFAQPAIAAPDGARWQGPALVTGHAWLWDLETVVIEGPGRHRLEIDGGPLAIDLGEGALTLGFARGGLDRVAVAADAAAVTNETSGRTLSLARLDLEVAPLAQADDGRFDIGFSIGLAGLPLPPEMAQPADLVGPEIGALTLQGSLQGTLEPLPWRAFLAAWRDSGGIVDLRQIELDWGRLWAKGAGTVTVDEDFRPLGAFSFETLGLPELIGRATEAGLVEENNGRMAESALGALSTGTDERGRQRVALPITLQDGWLYIGQIKLGQLRSWATF